MYYYKLYGLVFRSNEEIMQLLISEQQSNYDVEIIFGSVPLEIKDFIKQLYTEGYRENGFWFKNHKAIFHVTDGKRIAVEMLDNLPVIEAIPFVLGYCMSVLFAQRDMLAVHCSSVKINDKAILIAGYSGAGKTSLTTKFLEEGELLITDDVAIVGMEKGSAIVYPAFPQQNLCNDLLDRYGYDKSQLTCVDSDRDKYMINRLDKFCDTSTCLMAMFVLAIHKGDQVEFEEVNGVEKLKMFINNLFAEPVIKQYGLPVNLMNLSVEVVKNLQLYIIKRPENGDTTHIQMCKIRELIKSN